MAFYLPGTHVPHRKNTQNSPVARLDAPKTVSIPMAMHIGKPAKPIVKVGDPVKVGTKIAEADGYISSPIYSGVSGKVVKLEDYLLSNGATSVAVVIENDGLMEQDEKIAPPTINSREDLIAAIKESGIVGLGGAGFPTYVKFDVDPARIDYLVINGAECEPYVTSDTVTMMTREADISDALKALAKWIGIQHVVIGIENNKKEAILNMKKMAESIEECKVEVKSLPAVYPQGGEKVLVYHTVGRKIPVGKLLIDAGCVVINCTTLATIGAYLKTGLPLVEKCVTVDGGAVAQPQNIIAPIGASFADLFAACGGLKAEPSKLLYGGPMMGITVADDSAPILKNTNAILALTAKEVKEPKTTACIRCGACVNTCPFALAPVAIAAAFDKKDREELEDLVVDACMECGCCSFVCPANRPLVQINKLSKQFLREERMKEASKE